MAYVLWRLAQVELASRCAWQGFLVVYGYEEVLWGDVVVQRGADEESHFDFLWESAHNLVCGHILAIDRHLYGFVGENIDTDTCLDGVGDDFGSVRNEESKLGREGVLQFLKGHVLGLDAGDATVEVLRCIEVNGVGGEDDATLETSVGCGYMTVEDDGHTFVLSVGVEDRDAVGRGRFEGHTHRFHFHCCPSQGVGIEGALACVLRDVFEVDDECLFLVLHELIVEGVPAFAGVDDIHLAGHLAGIDEIAWQVLYH